ncbi:hypothetical protein O6H91_20G030900 [Diphasiastrum complanatum]|uniref:Uncharacterized protein n=1 Tax=Diphasiastrum complanatum TaxID=34168 RepID=A0ACC2ANZ2_DIPCM|nr:hypothetical protein O6H91_20G030900 [Diphasiastrum complanatum]
MHDHTAAVTIQSAYRRHMVKKMISEWSHAAANMQRLFRGHMGRVKAARFRHIVNKRLRMEYFNHQASIVQKLFRGYYSRKYVHSFYARKDFIASVMEEGVVVKKELHHTYVTQCNARHMIVSKKLTTEIEKFMASNHIHVSTSSQKGIFYSPYASILGKQNTFEVWIKATQKKRICQAHVMNKHGTLEKTKHESIYRNHYVTTMGPYVTPFEKRREEEKKAKLSQLASVDFITAIGREKSYPFKGMTIRIETEWGKHYKSRKDSQRKYEDMYLKVSNKPFFVVVPSRREFSCGGL